MDNINIDNTQVLRYLGYKNQILEDDIINLINEEILEAKSLIEPRHAGGFFTVLREQNNIQLKEYPLYLLGNDISFHLRNSKSCLLFCATLGFLIDRKINYYEKIDMAKAVILNACATAAIEEYCDEICREINDELTLKNEKLTSRFSPGYGDLPLNLQKDFLKAAMLYKNIGITASEFNILYPRKSITAILGVVDKALPIDEKSCTNCSSYEKCIYKKSGEVCGT